MPQTKQHNALIPKLRFKEFSDKWDKKQLNDLSNKISDGIHSTPKYDENGSFYFINGNNLINGTVNFSEKTKKISEEESKKHHRELTLNTILLSINGTIGNLAFYENEKIVLGKSACYINLKKELPKYFYYSILQTSTVTNFFNSELTGSTIKNLSLKTIKETNLFIPQLKEQQKIASFLTSVDKKIEHLQQKQSLLEEYKKGVMQQIFSQELRFKDDEGNEYPDWEEKRLGEIGRFFSGGTPKSTNKKYYSGSIPFIGSGNISDDNVKQFITSEAIDNSSAKMVEIGDLLYALYGATSGEIAISKMKGAINQAVLCIRTNENKSFLYQFLRFRKIYITSKFLQGGQGNLSANILKKLRIIIPSIEEQTKIANFLSAIDIKIQLINTQLEDTQQFKKGLLQQMFV